MANLDKTSVRSEVSRVKAEFERLTSEGKITSETQALMSSMLIIIELILSIFLEKTTKKDSKNSSIPPSQTEKDESTLTNVGSNSRGKNENDHLAQNTRIEKQVVLSKVTQCNVCAEDLTHVPCVEYESRTKIDIVFEKVILQVNAEIKQCPACNTLIKGEFPADMHGSLQYGAGLKAFVINLLVCQMVALNRVQKLIKAMIGETIAESTLLKFVMRLHQSLEVWERQAIEQILKAKAINVDETSLRVDKKNYWIHVYSSGDITLKFLHRKRGKEAIESIGIIPRFCGKIIHDCWSSYLSYHHLDHGLCGSHLLRELTFIIEANDYTWAQNMKQLLRETCKKVSKSEDKKLSDEDLSILHKKYQDIITQAEKELPTIPPKPSGKRGKIAKSDAHNLLERLKEYESSVLLFAKDPHVSFTNNRAERDLRMSKIKQKVSGCFRVVDYAHAYCRISSYLQTMANKGINPLIAIQMAFAGKFETEGGE